MAKKPVIRKKKKDNSMRNATVAFLITLCTFFVTLGLTETSNLIVAGLISLVVATLVKIMTTPLKGLNPEEPDIPATMDDYGRDMVLKGLELLEELRQKRDAIGEYIFTKRINDLANGYGELLNIVISDNDKATHLRKLNTYYLPTLIKLLQSYRDAKGQGTSYMEISATRDDLLKTLDQLITAVRGLKKTMLKSKLEDMDIKIEVLEEILHADGYLEDKETSDMRSSAEQAAASMPGNQPWFVPAQPQAAAPVQQPVQKPAPAVQPATTMNPTQPQYGSTPAPKLNVNVPTASAQQLSQGAPVLHVPGLFDEKNDNRQDDEQTLML